MMMMQMKLLLLLLLLQGRGRRTGVAAAATTAVVTFPFIERKMRLGLVEGVLQLADAPPAITCGHERLLPLLMLKFVELDRSECCLWRWVLWWFLVVMMVHVDVATVAILKILLPDIVLV